jgi:demethylmenaquinone methyltransferase/2-methoxy-6-polyprenyl-1,4-benzoquinol methylase
VPDLWFALRSWYSVVTIELPTELVFPKGAIVLSECPMAYQTTKSDVTRMFGRIASRYDLANSALSLGIHSYWRKKAFSLLKVELHGKKVSKALDVCTGTGALLEGLSTVAEEVTGIDICEPMLSNIPHHLRHIRCIQGDAEKMPFDSASFNVVTVGFGVRNFEDLGAGLGEIRRVLMPQGVCMILEFGEIQNPIIKALFSFYSRWVMPFLGKLITGDRAAYEYLPKTAKVFPSGESFNEILRSASLEVVTWKALTFGLCYVYIARAK